MSHAKALKFFVLVLLLALAVLAWTHQGRQAGPLVAGNYGYNPNPAGVREFLGELDDPLWRDAGAECLAKAQGKDTFLYRYADRASRAVYGKQFAPWNQGAHGSCVSFGWGMGSYIGQAVDWATGAVAEPPRLVATEPIYGGSRTAGRLPPVQFGGWSDGSYGAAAARWVAGLKNGHGGILYREKYGETDLSVYSIPRSKEWGAYGVPPELAKKANEHTAKAVALCETYEGLCAALEAGFCVPICSNVGFASSTTRDADGFLRRGGSWAHCMVIVSVRYAKNEGKRDGVLVLNSWGDKWVGGPKWPADQPDGSFWISPIDAAAILGQGDSFVIGGVHGFAWRDLHHGDWLATGPIGSDE